MWKTATPLSVPGEDRTVLRNLIASGTTPRRLARRARIVLGAAEGRPNNRLAKEVGVSRPTVILWRRRYTTAGILGVLKDAPRPGRPRRLRIGLDAARQSYRRAGMLVSGGGA